MQNITTDQRADRQLQIERRRAEAAARYPSDWRRMITEWGNPGDDRVWLTYSANYLCRTQGIRWALDPLTLHQRLPSAAGVDIAGSLSKLSFVLLSHRHADHLDLNLIRELRKLPIRWVIPEPLRREVIEKSGLQEAQVITPGMLAPLQFDDITITAFEGLHWEPSAPGSGLPPHGVPSVGYLVEFNGKRWLFPGDIRCYDPQLLPDFGELQGLFAHLWLGRRAALREVPPLAEAFCTFYANIPVAHIVITHLEELGREAEDYWDGRHFDLVANLLRSRTHGACISAAYLGESVAL